MYDEHFENALESLADLFLDNESKETFLRRYFSFYKYSKELGIAEDSRESGVSCEVVFELYDEILELLYFKNRKLGDKLSVVLDGTKTRSGKEETILIGELVSIPKEVKGTSPFSNVNYAFDDEGYVHYYDGYFEFKN